MFVVIPRYSPGKPEINPQTLFKNYLVEDLIQKEK